jgi:hypothetical protein
MVPDVDVPLNQVFHEESNNNPVMQYTYNYALTL